MLHGHGSVGTGWETWGWGWPSLGRWQGLSHIPGHPSTGSGAVLGANRRARLLREVGEGRLGQLRRSSHGRCLSRGMAPTVKRADTNGIAFR